MIRKLLFALAAAAVVTAAVSVIAQRNETSTDEEKRFEVRVTPEMLRHSRINETLYFVSELYGMATLLFVLASGISARLRDLAERVFKRRFLVAMLYIVFFALVVGALQFPLTLYGDYVVPHQFDLSEQSFASWMLDQLKGLGLALAIGAPLGALALLVVQKVRRWWLVLWLASLPVILTLVVIAPVLLDPVFNDFTRLKDPVLERALLDMASRAGIEGSRVYEVDKSKQTKTMNAYVTGVGPTKRIVMWDTLLAKMNRDEVLAVMGHEMGHYVMNHLWKGLAFAVATSFIVFFLGQHFYDRGLARWGAQWDARESGDPATAPWFLLVAAIIGFLLTPAAAGFSRHLEHQADLFGLELTHLNEPMASAFKKLAEDSKYDPDPNRFIELWHYSHPSTNERIRFALRYRPRGATGASPVER